MNDKILVRMADMNDKYITSYYTTNWSEAYKMYSAILNEELDIDITTFIDSDITDDINSKIFRIKAISVQFGSSDALNTLNIYVEELGGNKNEN